MDVPVRKPFIVLAVITFGCLILIGISSFLPIFVIEYDAQGVAGREEYYPDGYRYVNDNTGDEEFHNYDTENFPYEDLARSGVWTQNLRLITIVVFLALTLLLVLTGLGKMNPVPSIIVFAVVLVLCLIITVYSVTSFSSPLLDFHELEGNPLFGSQGDLSWSPGLGWLLILLSTVTVLACGIADAVLIWKERKKQAEFGDY